MTLESRIQELFGCALNATRLNLEGRKLKTLPPEIGFLTALKSLDLADNELLSLPPEFSKLIALEYLVLMNDHCTIHLNLS